MGLNLKNIITSYDSEDDLIFIDEFKKAFQFVQVKEFDSQFRGIIGQINENQVERKSDDNDDFLQKNNCNTFEDMVEEITHVPNTPFQGMEYQLEIHLLEKNHIIQKSSNNKGHNRN